MNTLSPVKALVGRRLGRFTWRLACFALHPDRGSIPAPAVHCKGLAPHTPPRAAPDRARPRPGVRSSRRPQVLDAGRASGRASASMRATRPCALAFATPCAARSAVWLSRVARIPPRASVRAIPGPIIPVPTTLAVANPVCDTSVILPACAPPGWRAANHGKGVDLVLARSTRTLEQ